ncbi:MAG: alpha amylase C-terminal domain-containing protein [Kiritimatiellia bacterium]|jgi:1,4-alpha-glucan branching enzyme
MPPSIARLTDDPYLDPFRSALRRREELAVLRAAELARGPGSLAGFACAHEYYGLHRAPDGGWVFREWAPNATAIALVGDFSEWRVEPRFALQRLPGDAGDWEIRLPADALRHGRHYRLEVAWDGGRGERIPAYARRVVQDASTHLFSAQVWDPPEPYRWRHPDFRVPADRAPLLYEAHVGMAQEREGVGTYDEFRRNILPRIADAGYNTIQLMAVMEHPYYGSFGYHVSSFFAASSRFGTPEELKALVDDAHGLGLAVIMDLVHSHAVRNERDGLSLFDGTPHQYFHDGPRGWHSAWDSRCFDYGKTPVLHFLLSNCRYWLDEFHFDGYRFDGVTSMLYLHHGLGVDFVHYGQYFDDRVDEDAWTYCRLANQVIHDVRPDAITVAEDVSGMPGLAAPPGEGGAGFSYRLAMGVTEAWFKLVRDIRDDDWSMGFLWHSLVDRRADERTVSYVESHDQALVGGKTFLFQMMDAEIYGAMARGVPSPVAERAVALHKMARLATLATAGHAYLAFMGNEFGHPEWVDFPREGNAFSYRYARRQWHLRDDPALRFHALAEFDRDMLHALSRRRTLESGAPSLLLADDAAKVLVFRRASMLFLFNFHPSDSLADFDVEVAPGRYRGVLDTDAAAYDGQSRIAPGQDYPCTARTIGRELRHFIRVYLPARTALAIERTAPEPR